MKQEATNLARRRILNLLGEEIGRAVRLLYQGVAAQPDAGYHFPTGREAALRAGYSAALLDLVPEEVLARFAGVGCPWHVGTPKEGDRVLDLGCGGGTDLFIAAHHVGPEGRVYGFDLTPEMAAAADDAVRRHGLDQVVVQEAAAPRIPDLDAPLDLVTSNGALNLVPEKEATLRRLHGLLRPGGRLVLADIALERPPAVACLRNAELWAECLVGAYTESDYLAALEQARFVDVAVHERRDYFSDSPSPETRETARDLGGFAWVVSARRA